MFTQIPFDHSVVTITQVWKLISGIIHHLIHHTHSVFVCATYTLQYYVYVIFLFSLHDSQYRFIENLSDDVSL